MSFSNIIIRFLDDKQKPESAMSSERRKESAKIDKQQTPDSTTKERCFIEGDEIFVLENDQYVFGEIKEVNSSSEKCLVVFPNGESLWVLFKNIKPTKNINLSPIKCCVVCKSTQGKKNNVVITCETCSRGYHQKCHKPIVKCLEDEWNCSLCCKEKNCQFSSNTTQKTVSSTSKDPSLPGSSEDLPYYSTSCGSHPQLSELPPTPPSSVSAPETPQPSIVNGEPPISPTEDVSCVDFDDVSPNERTLINLDEIFSDLKEEEPLAGAGGGAVVADISFPLPLNGVISGPLVRPTKRKLSEADLVVVDGEIKYKRRRSRKRISSCNLKAMETLASSTSSKFYGPGGSSGAAASAVNHSLHSPAKTFARYSDSDLRSLVRKYYEDENKQLADQEVDRIASGEEYRICGKRKTLDGRVQYLVEWFKCNQFDI